MSALTIALRAAGRLLVAGIISREVAAALIRQAWAHSAAELLPSGYTSNANEQLNLRIAEATDHWCAYCDDIPHRVATAGQRCPSCEDDLRRGRRAS